MQTQKHPKEALTLSLWIRRTYIGVPILAMDMPLVAHQFTLILMGKKTHGVPYLGASGIPQEKESIPRTSGNDKAEIEAPCLDFCLIIRGDLTKP